MAKADRANGPDATSGRASLTITVLPLPAARSSRTRRVCAICPVPTGDAVTRSTDAGVPAVPNTASNQAAVSCSGRSTTAGNGVAPVVISSPVPPAAPAATPGSLDCRSSLAGVGEADLRPDGVERAGDRTGLVERHDRALGSPRPPAVVDLDGLVAESFAVEGAVVAKGSLAAPDHQVVGAVHERRQFDPPVRPGDAGRARQPHADRRLD